MRKYLFKNNHLYFILLVIMQTLEVAASVGVALLLNYLIDEISSAISSGNSAVLYQCAMYSCIFAVIIGIIVFFTKRITAINIRHIITHIRQDMMTGIFNKRISDFQKSNTAEYITMLNQNMNTFEENYLKNIMNIYEAIISIILSTIALIYINPAVAVISIAAMSIPALIPKLFEKSLGINQGQIMQNTAHYNSVIQDTLNGFDIIQTFCITDTMKKQHLHAASDMEKSKSQLSNTMAILYGVSNAASVCAQFLIIVISGIFAVRGVITLGSIIAVTQLSSQVIGPAFDLSAKFGQLKSVKPVCNQMQEVIETKNYIKEHSATHKMKNSLCMKNVSFSYDNLPTIEKVSLLFQHGKKYAIVGQSGSGKSTLLKLLAGYYDNYSGEISVDGFSDVPCDISLITQDIFLFDDTIRNNITLYKTYPQEDIDRVIEISGLKNVIAESENGLETQVQENGARFSGGEKQRIAIARALLHQKGVLLLDEATSALDNETANKIEQNIIDLQDVTCITVTHKMAPSLLQQYDQIIVMDKGHIIEQGSYKELTKHDGMFNKLYSRGMA